MSPCYCVWQAVLPSSYDDSADQTVSQEDNDFPVDTKKVCCGFFHVLAHVTLSNVNLGLTMFGVAVYDIYDTIQ